MGGLIAAHIALRDAAFWRGVVLSAPALEADAEVATPVMKFLASKLSSWLPHMGWDDLEIEHHSTNRAVVEFAMQDPYFPKAKMYARWGNELLLAMDQARNNVKNATFPMLILHSKLDRICSITGSRWFFENAPSTDKTLREYDDMYHELFTETRRQVVLADVLRFLKDRCSRRN